MIENESCPKSHDTFYMIYEQLLSQESLRMTFHEVENDLHDKIYELARQMLQEYLDARGNGDVGDSIIREDNQKLSHKREGNCIQTTHFGKVVVKPQGYSNRGESQIFPLKEQLELSGRSFSYPVQKMVCFEAIKGPFEEVTKTIDEYTKAHVSKQQVQQIVEKVAVDFDEFYKTSNDHKEATIAEIIVASADCKGIVMRKEDLRETTRERAQSQKFDKRLSKGEKRNRKRMSTVASVYYIDPHKRDVKDVMDEYNRKLSNAKRPYPKQKRVWASVEKDSECIFEELSEEVASRVDKEKIVAFLSDGERKLQRLANTVLKKRVADKCKQFYIIIDIIHVIEYLWKAAHVFHREGDITVELFVQKYLQRILEGKAGQTTAAIGRSATASGFEGDKRAVVDRVIAYIKNNKKYMRYDEYMRLGLPIATGVIEGACKSLVKDRFEITGARWSLKGAESLLKLRSLYQSGDWSKYWGFHIKQEQERLYPTGFWKITHQKKPNFKVLSGGSAS